MKSLYHRLAKGLVFVITLTLFVFQSSYINSQTILNFTSNPPTRAVADFGVDYTPNRLQFVFWDSSTTNVVEWYWDFGDGDTASAQNTSHTYSMKGIYNVCLAVTNDKGCIDTTCKEINSYLGLDSKSHQKNPISIYPNPSNGRVFINFYLKKSSSVELSVYNVVGEEINNVQYGLLDEGFIEFELQPKDFRHMAGVYFVHLHIDGKVYIEKLIIGN